MAETISPTASKRCAVVTGANKGIGLEVCRQLASNGVLVILTARDEKRGHEAVENLRASGLSDVIFHQLDLVSTSSIIALADFIKVQFGKLDILVNNAAISGAIVNVEALRAQTHREPWSALVEATTQTYNLAKECIKTNYYGSKEVTEALLPLLCLSISARVVNISSELGQLEHITNEWAKEVLSDVDSLTEEKIDQVLNKFLKDYKEGLLETKNWPSALSAYIVSKATMNAYTRILAKAFPSIIINCGSPGYTKTDMTYDTGYFSVEEGGKGPVMLALLPDGAPSGLFFVRKELGSF